jgi:GT2 family glycosyltransferase
MSRFFPWKIVHIELRQSLPELTADAGTGGLFVVFWCQGVPVGQLWLPASLLPINSAQLAAMAAQRVARAVGHGLMKSGYSKPPFFLSPNAEPGPDLAQVLKIERPLESFSQLADSCDARDAEVAEPPTSVIICTRNRPEALRNCLSSLRSLSPQPNEIIVVDNDPSSHLTTPVVAQFPEIRYVPEPRTGLSAARNTGVRSSIGEIIAFTDDDVVVHPAWIAAILRGFEDPKIMSLTGAVLPAELATDAQFAFQNEAFAWELGFEGYEALDFDSNFFRNTTHLGVPVWRMGAGANMAFRREAFNRVGLFDERLGAGTSGCSEDSELWYRLLAEGYQCRYDPSAVVSHFHRSDWAGLSYQTYSYMRGHVAALLFQFDRYEHWGNVKRAFAILPLYFTKLALRAFIKGLARFLVNSDEDQPSLASPLHQKIRGMLAGYAYYLRHRHLPADPMAAATTGNNNGRV